MKSNVTCYNVTLGLYQTRMQTLDLERTWFVGRVGGGWGGLFVAPKSIMYNIRHFVTHLTFDKKCSSGDLDEAEKQR